VKYVKIKKDELNDYKIVSYNNDDLYILVSFLIHDVVSANGYELFIRWLQGEEDCTVVGGNLFDLIKDGDQVIVYYECDMIYYDSYKDNFSLMYFSNTPSFMIRAIDDWVEFISTQKDVNEALIVQENDTIKITPIKLDEYLNYLI
jgi:hypothetical protein